VTSRLGSFIRKEIREIVRDRRAVMLSFVMPVLIYRVMFTFMSRMERRTDEMAAAEVHRVAVSGAAAVREAIAADGRFALVGLPADPEAAVRAGDLEVWIDAPDSIADAEEDTGPVVRIVYHMPHERSRDAEGRVYEVLDDLRREEAERRYAEAGGRGRLAELLAIERTDVATEQEAAGARAGALIPYLLVMTLFVGAAAVSTDIVAGEKERGTLETLYLVPVSRDVIARAKFLVVWGATVITGGLNLASMAFCYRSGMIGDVGAQAAALSAGGIALAFALVVPLAAVVAGIMLGLSAIARNVKEAQLYLAPVMFVAIVPGMLASRQSVALEPFTALLPIANVALAVRDGLVGRADPAMLGLVFVASVGWGLLITRWTARVLSREDTILGFSPEPLFAGTSGGRRRAAMFALAATVLGFFYAGNLLQSWRLVPGLILSLWVVLPVLGAASAWFARSGATVRELLSLRAPRPAAVLGAVCLGAGILVPMFDAVMRFQGTFLPMPDNLMGNLEEEIGGFGTVPLLLLMAVSPGICEELVFRGVFLGLLRRVGSTRYAVLMSSAGFAIIHMSVFRFLPTFILGVLMASVVVRTRSIVPAMLLHAVYNGLAVGAMERIGEDPGVLAWAVSVGLFAAGVTLIRSPAART